MKASFCGSFWGCHSEMVDTDVIFLGSEKTKLTSDMDLPTQQKLWPWDISLTEIKEA